MSTAESTINYWAPNGGWPPVLAPLEIENFQRECQDRRLESFAGIIYFEDKALSVAGLLRVAGINPAVLADPQVLVGPYVSVDIQTGRPTSYTGIMLYREAVIHD